MMYSVVIGWCAGFLLGVGCALAVQYSIYRGGYRKAVQDGLKDPQPETYRKALAKAKVALETTGSRGSGPVRQDFRG